MLSLSARGILCAKGRWWREELKKKEGEKGNKTLTDDSAFNVEGTQ